MGIKKIFFVLSHAHTVGGRGGGRGEGGRGGAWQREAPSFSYSRCRCLRRAGRPVDLVGGGRVPDDAVGLQGRQHDVEHPQEEEEAAGGPLGAHGAAELRLAEDAQQAADHQQGDAAHRADGVDGHAEAQRAGLHPELAVAVRLRGKKKKNKQSKFNMWEIVGFRRKIRNKKNEISPRITSKASLIHNDPDS